MVRRLFFLSCSPFPAGPFCFAASRSLALASDLFFLFISFFFSLFSTPLGHVQQRGGPLSGSRDARRSPPLAPFVSSAGLPSSVFFVCAPGHNERFGILCAYTPFSLLVEPASFSLFFFCLLLFFSSSPFFRLYSLAAGRVTPRPNRFLQRPPGRARTCGVSKGPACFWPVSGALQRGIGRVILGSQSGCFSHECRGTGRLPKAAMVFGPNQCRSNENHVL